MYSAIYQSNHPSTAGALNNIGLAYKKLGYISKGLRYLEEALRMKQKLYPNNHPDIASSFNNVGVAYDELGYISKGLKYKEASLKMYKAIYRGNHSSTADSLTNVGVTYDKLGNTTKALEYFELALKMYQALYKNDHPCIAGSLNNVGLAYEKLGYISKGLKYKEEALKIYQRLYQANHPCIASSFSSIALSYKKSEDTNKAIELCKQAYLMYGQTLGLEHPNTKFIRSYLKTVTPEFIKNNEIREFILQRGDFEEVTLEIKQKIQKNVLNKIYISAAKDKWNSKFSILGNWGVKGYLGDRYLAKQLGALANVKNIEIAKMLCFEAICLGAINSPSKNFACVKEFARAYPEVTNKITNEHPEYFIDGSILRAYVLMTRQS